MPTSNDIDDVEKRSEPRLVIQRQFRINHDAIGEVVCNSRDLSLKGAFMLGDFTALSIGSSVAVSFILPSKRPGSNEATRYHFSAVVVRIDDTGVGLNFAGMDEATDAAIFDLMHR